MVVGVCCGVTSSEIVSDKSPPGVRVDVGSETVLGESSPGVRFDVESETVLGESSPGVRFDVESENVLRDSSPGVVSETCFTGEHSCDESKRQRIADSELSWR